MKDKWEAHKQWLIEYLSKNAKPKVWPKAGETWYLKTWRGADITKSKILYISDNIVCIPGAYPDAGDKILEADGVVFVERVEDV